MSDDRDARDIQKLFDLQGETDGKVDTILLSQTRMEERVSLFLDHCQRGDVRRCIDNAARIASLEMWREKTTGFWARLFWVCVTAGVGAMVALLAKLMFK